MASCFRHIRPHHRINSHSLSGKSLAIPNAAVNCCGRPALAEADAARLAFSRASGELLMIVDADLRVPPEGLPRFYDANTGQRTSSGGNTAGSCSEW